MKPLLPFCLALSLIGSSCERHLELRHGIATLAATVKQDEAVALQYQKDIAAAGGTNALPRIVEQTGLCQARVRLLESNNAAKARKWSAIETRLAVLKPAAEAYQAAPTR